MPVVITGVDGVFNGSYTITAVTSLTFSYAKTNAAVSPTAVSPSGTAVAGKLGRGNLVLATSQNGSQNHIVFAAGGLGSDNTQMTIIPDDRVHIEIATNSTSTTTGALTIAGGLGVTGNVNVGGNVNIAGTITFGGTGTTVQTDNITVVDPVVLVASGNTGNSVDFSFAGKYVSSGTKYAAFVRTASTGVWNLVSGLTSAPTASTTLTGATYDDLKLGDLITTGYADIAGTVTVATNKVILDSTNGAITAVGTVTTPKVTITGAISAETDAVSVAATYSAIAGAWSVKNSAYTLVNRDAVFADSTSGTFTLTLPATPAVNNRVRIADLAGTWAATPVTLSRNGNKIMGLSEDYSLNVKNASVDLIYSGATYGWRFV
jgi:cytoskeletal protein CcmA (bactofilin family)